MAGSSDSVDSYIALLDDERRVFAERLRALIRGAVPQAVEAIKYDMPAFQIGGRSSMLAAATSSTSIFSTMTFPPLRSQHWRV